MSFWKDLVDSFSQLFSIPSPSSDPQPMDAAAGPSVVSERVVNKLKGYFELAKEEIDKAVRAEEWGLTDDAIGHYKNAHRIMLEAKAARVPSALPSSDQEKVRFYQQKILKWQENVTERLRVLSKRTGGVSPKKTNLGQSLNKAASSTSVTTKAPLRSLPSSKRSTTLVPGNQKNISGPSKPTQDAANNYDSKLIEMINTAIVDRSPAVKWDDVAGLEKAKQTLLEMVILPTKRRDLFTGLRKPARGLLLFGPPGNGKTMLAKAVASESDATFFNLSASSLTSKWVLHVVYSLWADDEIDKLKSLLLSLMTKVGEAEKLVRTLFMVAISRQPSVIFIDEIDSIMSTRLANENDASRRLKSEFLVQFDGVTSNPNDLVIVIGATNKPQEIDDAVLRRLVKRIYIPLPDHNVRRLLLKNQLKGQAFSLPGGDLERLVKETEGYSGSDLQALCEEAAMMPIRELGPQNILTIKANQVRPLRYGDFQKAMSVIRPSLQKSKWEELEQWNQEFGSN